MRRLTSPWWLLTLLSFRMASTRKGTELNLSNGKRPEPGDDPCTASGASATSVTSGGRAALNPLSSVW